MSSPADEANGWNRKIMEEFRTNRGKVGGSVAGAPSNPDWYRNLVANPSVTAEIGTATSQFHARTATGDERESIWAEQKREYSGFASYEAMTDRVIPIVVLDPA